MYKFGIGYDVHRISKERDLFLGGIKIENDFGLDGHSDADVLLHSICDSILGALALGDIGIHFPNTDKQFKGISSLKLLEKVNDMIINKGFFINNIDSTIIAEKPKLSPFIPEMQKAISKVLNCNPNIISIKATTNESIGFIGRGEGIAAISIASLIEK